MSLEEQQRQNEPQGHLHFVSHVHTSVSASSPPVGSAKPLLNTRHSVSPLRPSVLGCSWLTHTPSFLLLLCVLLSELLIPDEETGSNLHVERSQLVQGGTTRASLPLQVSFFFFCHASSLNDFHMSFFWLFASRGATSTHTLACSLPAPQGCWRGSISKFVRLGNRVWILDAISEFETTGRRTHTHAIKITYDAVGGHIGHRWDRGQYPCDLNKLCVLVSVCVCVILTL